MFGRTFSFWRRLVGRTAPRDDGGGVALEEDRRLWVRYQADTETQVQLSQQGQAERVSAHLRDISAGGAQLISDRPFQGGQILSIELPTAQGDDLQVVLRLMIDDGYAGNRVPLDKHLLGNAAALGVANIDGMGTPVVDHQGYERKRQSHRPGTPTRRAGPAAAAGPRDGGPPTSGYSGAAPADPDDRGRPL